MLIISTAIIGFGKDCYGNIDNFQANTALCCKDQSEIRTGGCRYCQSCGREFPEKVGGGYFTSPKAIQSFDTRCSGNARNRGVYSSLCCSKPSPCKLCQSCGGDYHFESSARQLHPKLLLRIESFGLNCQGSLTMGSRMAKLCCKHG